MKIIVATTPTCIKCKELHRILDDLKVEYEDKGIHISIDYKNLADGSEESAKMINEYNLKSVPFTIFLDNEGAIHSIHRVLLTKSEIKDIIDELK